MGNFPKDEETVPVSTRACARLLAVLEVLGVCPESPVNPVDAAAFVLEGVVDAVAQLNSAATKRASEPDILDGSATSKCQDDPNQDFFQEPTEEELEALDEVIHASNCRIWHENEETDCDCGAGAVDGDHEYEHGGEA